MCIWPPLVIMLNFQKSQMASNHQVPQYSMLTYHMREHAVSICGWIDCNWRKEDQFPISCEQLSYLASSMRRSRKTSPFGCHTLITTVPVGPSPPLANHRHQGGLSSQVCWVIVAMATAGLPRNQASPPAALSLMASKRAAGSLLQDGMRCKRVGGP